MIRIMFVLTLVACGPGLNPIGDWSTQITPGPGNCGYPPTAIQMLSITMAGSGYLIDNGDPTLTGTIDCNDDRCVLDFYQTITSMQEHATWTADADDNVTGIGSIMIVGPQACVQALTFVGTLN